jgi:UDP-N-acetylmuramate--alanine ligase
VRSILPQVTKPVTTYGFSEDAQVRAMDARADGVHMHFTVRQAGYPDTEFVLNQPGMHNVLNACSAIAIAREIGIDDSATAAGPAGVPRRRPPLHPLRRSGAPGGGSFTLVDDFGHHPVETEVTLAAARAAYPGRRLVLAFQPHRYSRTRDLFEDFVKVLAPRTCCCWPKCTRPAKRRSWPPTAARWRVRCAPAARSNRFSWKRSPRCRPR